MIDDDVAVQDSLYTAGRRGVGATVLAEKICGAAAELRRPLTDVAELCRRVNERRPQHGHGADLVHRADGRQAHLRARPRRDGDRHRHPRRAGPRAPPAGPGRTSRGDAGDGDPRRSALRPRRPRAGLRQRHGRHAAHGALRRVPASSHRLLRGPRHHRRPQPDRHLHHLARHGGLLDHAAALDDELRRCGTRRW